MARLPVATHFAFMAFPRSSLLVQVVGGGLAGSEAAYQLAERGFDVLLHEMRPVRGTPAHKTDRLAELVCSNTFKSTELTNAHGLLKAEMRAMGSLILQAADEARVPGRAERAVDRHLARLRIERLDQLAGEDRDVGLGHVKQDGQVMR